MDKLKQLRRYIEPLTRLINKKEANPESKQDVQKMKSLRDILIGQNRVTMQILEKCERVLQQIHANEGPERNQPERNDQHMCQALLDVVSDKVLK